MRKLTRFLACFLAAVLVVSNLQYVGVKAVEVEEIIIGAEGTELLREATTEEVFEEEVPAQEAEEEPAEEEPAEEDPAEEDPAEEDPAEEDPAEDENSKEVTEVFNFNNGLSAVPEGKSVTVNEDGSATIDFEAAWESSFFNIPEAVKGSKISKIKFLIENADETALVAKSFTADQWTANHWETQTDAAWGSVTITPNEETSSALTHLAITSFGNADPAPGYPYTLKITGVEFTYVKSPISYGDNIIKNPYFAEDDLSVWSMGTRDAEIKVASEEEAIFDEITTYGVIDRDAEVVYEEEDGKEDARHEFFAQDITEAIAAGGDLNRKPKYKVEFYAKLSDDYKDAPAEQRVVEFAPYIVTEQDGPVYLGASYSAQLSGNLSQELKVGEWTKYSGTFEVAHDGYINQVVIRVIEQGTQYGDINKGACVKGDYCITGFSMQEVIEPETTIEENIPNWKDAITDAFGDDAIAGTCLGSGTITMDHLTALAKKHFNAITFENEMKPDITLGSKPKFDENGELVYNFKVADRMMAKIKAWNDESDEDDVDFKIRGHVLVWHSQTPEWFFHENYDVEEPFLSGEKGKAEMNRRLEHYIKGVFEHYNSVKFEDGTTAADMFYGWDVVNEAMSDSTGKPRKATENSNWAKVYGDQSNEYIINAFRYANKYAPENIRLYYNDYNDSNEPKATGIAELLETITKAEKDAENPTRIDGMGMQAHHNYSDPTAGQIKSAINKYLTALGDGGIVEMTEFDVKASKTYDGSAASLKSEHSKQAWRFKEVFDAYKEIEAAKPGSVGGITMWGVVDERSWLQSSNSVGGASSGGTHAPLLFYTKNYEAKAKPAFYAFFDEYIDTLEPMIQSVTVMQQVKKDNFDIGYSYDIGGEAKFVPMWTKEGLVMKVIVTDASDDKEKDTITVYVDEAGSKTDGDYKKVTVARNAEGVKATETGYEAIINVPMPTASAKMFSMDIVVDNNGEVVVFNDKKDQYTTSSKYYAEAIMKPYTSIASGSAVIDAEEDAIWASVEAIPLTIKLGAKADATVKALWDKEYLYVYADVKDEELDATSTNDYEDDSLEVFIDENNAKSDSYQEDDKQYRVSYENLHSFNGKQCAEENIESATKIVEGYGYIVEAKFKWTHVTPALGDEIGIEFQINDAKGGKRLGTASWYDTSGNGWSSPAVFGTALLGQEVVVDTPAEQPGASEQDTKAANAVVEKIKAIGTVTYDEKVKALIDEARKAYDALTDEQKKLVPADVLKVLTDAEATYKAEAEKAEQEAKVEYFAKFSVKSIPLKKGQKSNVLAKDIQIAKGDKVTKWKSSNPKIVSVDKKGTVKGKKVGTAEITAYTQSGKKATIKVKVQKSKVKATKITLANKATGKAIKSKATVTLKKGKKMTVVANVKPMTCTEKVKFTSSNKKVATVSNKGVIKAKKKGTATITAKVGKKTFKFKVKVK